ncbi:MAG: hypothetical protein ABIU54_09845 [Candidatus Eisenbacteria bacterium]
MDPRRLLHALALIALVAVPTHASAPPPLNIAGRFTFPAAATSPGDAVSAGLARSDRWIGMAPFDNPALAPARGVVVSPLAMHGNRQDLSAANREFEQTFVLLDFAGASLTVPIRAVSVSLYAWQPVIRREEMAFNLGNGVIVGPPARLALQGEARESIAGLALSLGHGDWRWGVAGEWRRRADQYASTETSGSPESGKRDLAFDGSGISGGAGFTWRHQPDQKWGWRVGGAVHVSPALDVTGQSVNTLLTGDTTIAVSATREGLWGGGLSARLTLSAETHVFATAGSRTSEEWTGLGFKTGAASEWRAGIEYRDSETPYAVRAGLGMERFPGSSEPKAGVIGLGFSLYSGETVFDLGLTHRTLSLPESPNSYDTRLLGSVRVSF